MRSNLQATIAGIDAASTWRSLPGTLRWGVSITLAVATLTLASHLKVPMWPVPMTMQSLAVVSVGAVLGSTLAGTAVFTYILLGALGFSVFAGAEAGQTGLAYILGPTGGYLVGFIAAAMATGRILHKGSHPSVLKVIGALLLANALIYGFGLAWMAVLFGAERGVGWILQYGMYNFLLGDLLKVGLAAGLISVLRRST